MKYLIKNSINKRYFLLCVDIISIIFSWVLIVSEDVFLLASILIIYVVAYVFSKLKNYYITNLQYKDFLYFSGLYTFYVIICSLMIFGWFSEALMALVFSYFLSLNVRLLLSSFYSNKLKQGSKQIILYGINSETLHLKLLFDSLPRFQVVGFYNDEDDLRNRIVLGLDVYSGLSSLELLKNRNYALYLPNNVETSILLKIGEKFSNYFSEIKKLPSLDRLTNSLFLTGEFDELNLEKLLNRDEITGYPKSVISSIQSKVILVTGGGGSIGGELCKQLLSLSPAQLIVVDNCEFNLFEIQNKLHESELDIRFHLIDVTDFNALDNLFNLYSIDIIFHAAAYKHVPIVENNIHSGLRNNILGAYNTIQLAVTHKASQYILVSTDKAVNPTNVMGASKRFCELLISYFYSKALNTKTSLVTTRFGNVLGSRGSVIPTFLEQIKTKGEVNVTHREITRYFMTIPEAARLLIEAATLGLNNEVFVFDMGKPVKIYDLAKNIIRSKGFTPDIDIKVNITGLRPGEKLYEELLTSNETLISSENPKLFRAKKESLTEERRSLIESFIQLISKDDFHLVDEYLVVSLIKEIVPEFISSNSRFDQL